MPPISSSSSSSSSKSKIKTKTKPKPKQTQPRQMANNPKPTAAASSWDQFKNILSCKQVDHLPRVPEPSGNSRKPGGGRSSCRSICSFRDVVHGNTRVVHRADHSPESSSLGLDETRSLTRKPVHGSSRRSLASSYSGTTASSSTTSSRGMQFRKLSGCYECHMILDPSKYPIMPRATMCACPKCGEIFPKIESLEHHQAIKHAVSDLGPEDSGRNIVEIIFKSSWMKKENPICKIERILKVHNSQRTIQRFEECRDAVKIRGNGRKNARCAADGNELLRFQCSPLACALGSRGSSALCADFPACGVCTIIRHGFQGSKGVRTTASSGRAHDLLDCSDGRRAMLVCRVIAGRVKRLDPTTTPPPPPEDAANSYDSVAASSGVYSNLEDLTVFNPRAILPCFVVIYKTLNSIT
ncbi:hypothetical protein V2J09_018106 [Rumex salicifolius]